MQRIALPFAEDKEIQISRTNQDGEEAMRLILTLMLVLVLCTSALGLSKKLYQMKDDLGTEPTCDCVLQYYYYIPCPTYSWFWAYSNWTPGDIIGEWYRVGDQGTGGFAPCNPEMCHKLEMLRVLDFAGYGTTYPGLYTVQFNVYCLGSNYCPVMPSLWTSGPVETKYGWNFITINPPVCLTGCYSNNAVTFLVTATMIGTDARYPAWGMDNVSTPATTGCQMHDSGCLPATYPRQLVHSGYYGDGGFQYCPPLYFCDGNDQTQDCSQYGFIELAWRAYFDCSGPSATEQTTWSKIKSVYR